MQTLEDDSGAAAYLVAGGDARNGSYETVRFNAMKHGIPPVSPPTSARTYGQMKALPAGIPQAQRRLQG